MAPLNSAQLLRQLSNPKQRRKVGEIYLSHLLNQLQQTGLGNQMLRQLQPRKCQRALQSKFVASRQRLQKRHLSSQLCSQLKVLIDDHHVELI